METSGKVNKAAKFSIENILGPFLHSEKDIETRELMNIIDDTELLSDEESMDESEAERDFTDFDSELFSREPIKREDHPLDEVRSPPIPTISSHFPPIQPRPPIFPRPSLLVDPLLYTQDTAQPTPTPNLFYPQWLTSGSKPPPIFFGLQGMSEINKLHH